MVMDIKEIQEFLPHRYPFLLVDRVVELELGSYIKAYKNVSVNEQFFNGHFPDYPIMPGVLIIEALAQASGVLGFKTGNKRPRDGYVYYYVGSDNIRLKRPVYPGDQLILESRMVKNRRGVWKFECQAFVGDELVCQADIMCAERKVA